MEPTLHVPKVFKTVALNTRFFFGLTIVWHQSLNFIYYLTCVHRTQMPTHLILTHNSHLTPKCDLEREFWGVKMPRCASSNMNNTKIQITNVFIGH